MSPSELTAALKEEARRLGFQLAGATPAATPPSLDRFRQWLAEGFAGEMRYMTERATAYEHPEHVLPGVRSLLMLAAVYRTAEPQPAGPGEGLVARYAWSADYHDTIRRRLHALADFHRRLVPTAAVRGVVDTAPLLERQFAQLAGLGWIGKNTLLINPQLGSWLFLAALLTSEPLTYDDPAGYDRCGTCRACLDACPTGALVEPRRLDARKCISYLTIEARGPIPAEFQPSLGQRVFGCDACQDVCPWNRRAAVTSDPDFQPLPGMNPFDLRALAATDAAEFRARFGHTALARAGHAGMQRNAAAVLPSPLVGEGRG